jgi:hypothetical protein
VDKLSIGYVPLKLGMKGMSFMHHVCESLESGIVGKMLDYIMDSASRNPDPNALKEMVRKHLLQHDRVAIKQNECRSSMVEGLRVLRARGVYAGDWGLGLRDRGY